MQKRENRWETALFEPLFEELDRRLADGCVLLAIEGGSASGKSTLAALLEKRYDCTVFHMDDFFLRPEQRTAARYAEVGGNVDRERFLDEVLRPLKRGQPVTYRKFNCGTMSLEAPETVVARPLTVVEGAYAMHPDLAAYYDFSVFLDVSADKQRARISARNSAAFAKRFFEEWIPFEQTYFEKTAAKERCDTVITVR